MASQLIIIDGLLKGTSVALSAADVSIGRDEASTISLEDILVSRRHAAVRPTESGYCVYDLESRNGVAVNGVPVKERALAHGDAIQIGKTTLLYVAEASFEEPVAVVELHADAHAAPTAVRLEPREAIYFDPERLSTSVAPAQQRVARELSALLRIGMAVGSSRSSEALARLLLERVFEVVPAERGAVLLLDGANVSSAALFGWDRGGTDGETDGRVRVSRTIVDHVVKERVGILSNDVPASDRFGSAASLVAARVRSVLAVPLVVRDRAVGALYLESGESAAPFDEGHLQFAAGVAGIGAAAIETASSFEGLEREAARLRDEIDIKHDMVGESPAMRAVLRFIARVAPIDSTVLVGGESGTGKELVARAIHRNSPRAARPFVAINCAALTEALLESELFGHEKGAFTGAVAQRRGKLEAADGGTLFLDEVGELAPVLQAKLLRVLQEREFERVGGTRPVRVDIRLVAATNRKLEEAAAAGTFRRDLFYRLNVVSLTMPPLRERRSDIPLLASYFVRKFAPKCNREVNGLSSQARAVMLGYDWPGNVRELQNAVERAVALGSTDRILLEDLPEALLERAPAAGAHLGTYHAALASFKRQLVLDTLERTGGKLGEAAKLLGVHRNYLSRLVRGLDIKTDQER